MTAISWPVDDALVARVGGKAAALARLAAAGFDVPDWFVVTTGAAQLPADEVARQVGEALARLVPDGSRVAVRSSGVDEDGTGHSFAGQYDTFLDVSPADTMARIEDVRASAASPRLAAYRRERGLSATTPALAVLVQRMVSPDAAGVAFSSDPVSGRRSVAVVAAVPGLGDGLVSGETEGDGYDVGADGAVRVRGLRAGAATRVLDDGQVRAVADLARRVATHAGRPQDIEWAMAGGRLHLLQARPITTLTARADPDGTRRIWDNSNIAESYGGVTTPLTFSFARGVYAEVYRQFCVLLAVPRAVVDDRRSTFENMLGLVRGRVYYNLISWYRVLAMLPGFTVNRRFMEQMMGVREPMPDEALADDGAPAVGRWRDGLRLARAVAGLAVALARLPAQIAGFQARLDAALGPAQDLSRMRLDELTAHYRALERQLLTRWDAPLVNDFFAMIFYGTLRAVCARWAGDAGASLQNDLLAGESGIVSAEPVERLQTMAGLAAAHGPLVATLQTGTLDEIRRAIAAPGLDAFARAYHAYLEKFSDRCLDELKLETPTLADDPLVLCRAIGALAGRERVRLTGTGASAPGGASPASSAAATDRRHAAEARFDAALRWHPLRRIVARWVLRQARDRVRWRENLRFERTRVFGRVRRVVVEAGRRLAAEGRLTAPDDVFYLQIDEVLGIVEGTVTAADLAGLALVRRREFDTYRALPAPADRFETRGAVWIGHDFAAPLQTAAAAAGGDDERLGLGCSPGIVEGRARVVHDPRHAVLAPGDVLVAERTDPGWVLLFPLASAVVVERGSVLSHSAIVSRELGLPAVVSLPGLTTWLQDGDVVRVDGTTGRVRRLSRAAAP